jgi:hypothetical protein
VEDCGAGLSSTALFHCGRKIQEAALVVPPWRAGSLSVTLAASAHNLAFSFWRSVAVPSSAT